MAKRERVTKGRQDPNAGNLDNLDDEPGNDEASAVAPRSSGRRVQSGQDCPAVDAAGRKCSGTLRTLLLRNVKRGTRTVQVPRLICDTCKARFGGE